MGLDQYAIRKFAESFDVVPRTLAENSGLDATSTMYALHHSHASSGSSDSSSAHMGLDIDEGKPFNAAQAGVFDLYACKANALRLAVDAALTVLRVSFLFYTYWSYFTSEIADRLIR
jgi:T-complex protein 1 subunit theta